MAGFEATHVPYRGSSPRSRRCWRPRWISCSTPPPPRPSGSAPAPFRGLGVSTATRASALPEVPTIAEAGIAGYAVSVWNTLLVPRRTPEPVVARLRQAFAGAMDATTQMKLRAAYVDPLLVPPAELEAWLEREQSTWLRMSRDAGVTVD